MAQEVTYLEANLKTPAMCAVWNDCLARYLECLVRDPAQATRCSGMLKECMQQSYEEHASQELSTAFSDYLKTPCSLTFFAESPPVSDAAMAILMEWYDPDEYIQLRRIHPLTCSTYADFYECLVDNRIKVKSKQDYTIVGDYVHTFEQMYWKAQSNIDSKAIYACAYRNKFEQDYYNWVRDQNTVLRTKFEAINNGESYYPKRCVVLLHQWFKGLNMFTNYDGFLHGLTACKPGYRVNCHLVLFWSDVKFAISPQFLHAVINDHSGRQRLLLLTDAHDSPMLTHQLDNIVGNPNLLNYIPYDDAQIAQEPHFDHIDRYCTMEEHDFAFYPIDMYFLPAITGSDS